MGVWGSLCLSCCCRLLLHWAAVGGKKGVMGGEEEGNVGKQALPT